MSRPIGINIVGHASANSGLGVVTREYARALIANGHPVSILDLDLGEGRSGLDLSLQTHFVPSLEELPHEVSVWVFGATGIASYAKQLCRSASARKRFNVAFVWWELPNLPPPWLVCAQAFDAFIGASEFIRESWANHVCGMPVLLAPAPLSLPVGVLPDRARFGLPDGPLLIFTGFEPQSDPVRKNPFAAVHAFRRAFPADTDVRLVIKVNNPEVAGKLHAGMERLHELIQGDDRVVLLNERLSYHDLLSLYASCDIVMSLHRAEGLGLIPLEAMRLGKAVVATGWSGNMTYMNHCNAALVRYNLVATDETATHYSPSALGVASHWAEPDIDHAAAWLRALAKDESLRLGYGQQAMLDSEAYDQRARAVGFADELAALYLQRDLVPAKNHKEILASVQVAVRRDRLRRMGPLQRQITRAKHALTTQLDRHVMWRLRSGS